jgi:hypothetical protein
MVVDNKKMMVSGANGTVATGGYQNNGGGSVTTGIGLNNTNQSQDYKLDGLGNWKSTTFLPAGQDITKRRTPFNRSK